MAERRMFSKKIINSARFLKMPSETQALYFHLGLQADDDGIVEAYSVMKAIGASDDNLRILVAKNLVQVLNDDLVSFILDWTTHNKIRPDRKIDSIYKNLLLQVNPNIPLIEPKIRADVAKKRLIGQQMDVQWTTNGQPSIGKVSEEIHIPAKMQGDDAVLSEKFSLIWKEYSISFLKAKFGRRGGSKDKAKKMFLALVAKEYSIQQIADLIIAEHSLNFPRDLERVLRLDSMKQFIEDKEASND